MESDNAVGQVQNAEPKTDTSHNDLILQKCLSKKEEEDEEEEEEEEDKIVDKSPNGRFHKRNKRFPRQMQGVDNAFVAIEPKSGKEVIWNESYLPEKKTERENRFLAVIKKLKKTSHPFLVRFLDAWISKPENGPRILVFITERLDEGTLKQYLCNSTRNIKLWKRHIGQLLSVLMHLHSLGVTHGNLTKENIYYQNYGSLKVGPFALAGFLDQKAQSADVYMLGMIALEIAVWEPADDNPTFSTADRIKRMLERITVPDQRDFIEACLENNLAKRPKIRALIYHPTLAEVPTLKLLSANVIVKNLRNPTTGTDEPVTDSGTFFNSLLKDYIRNLEDDTIILEVKFPQDGKANYRFWKDFRSNFTLTAKYLDDVKNGFYPLFTCREVVESGHPESEDGSGQAVDETVTCSAPQTNAINTPATNSINSSRKHSHCHRTDYAFSSAGILTGTGSLQGCQEGEDTPSPLERNTSETSDISNQAIDNSNADPSKLYDNPKAPDFDTEEALDTHAKNMVRWGEVPFVEGFNQADSISAKMTITNLTSYSTPNEEMGYRDYEYEHKNNAVDKFDELTTDLHSRNSHESNVEHSPSWDSKAQRRESLEDEENGHEQQHMSNAEPNEVEYDELEEDGANSDEVSEAYSSGDEAYFPEGLMGGHHVSFSIAGAANSFSDTMLYGSQGESTMPSKMLQPPKLVYVTAPEKCPTEPALFTHCQYIYVGCGRWQVYIQVWFVEERLKRETTIQILDYEWHDIDSVANLFLMSKCLGPNDRHILLRLLSLARHNYPLIDGELRYPLPSSYTRSDKFDSLCLYERLVALHLHQQACDVSELLAIGIESRAYSGSVSPTNSSISQQPESVDMPPSGTASARKPQQSECICEPDQTSRLNVTTVEHAARDTRPSVVDLEGMNTTAVVEDEKLVQDQKPSGILVDIGSLGPRNAGCANCDRHDYLHRQDLPGFLTAPCYHCRESLAREAKISNEAMLDLYLQNGIPWPAYFQYKFKLPPEQSHSLDELITYDCKWRSRAPCVCHVAAGGSVMPPCVEFPWLYDPPVPLNETNSGPPSVPDWESRSVSVENSKQEDEEKELCADAQGEEGAEEKHLTSAAGTDCQVSGATSRKVTLVSGQTLVCSSRHPRGCPSSCSHGFSFPKIQASRGSSLPPNLTTSEENCAPEANQEAA
ncbi:Nuclear receptor-binding protein [Cichlidogyrus casuarinus]|uniref:Nuclear receptor-binding protein n=1 Tax=Cichlidogyrus casuarinus TaxID=1844966 RepID=A0ABD2QLK7_9PLAT